MLATEVSSAISGEMRESHIEFRTRRACRHERSRALRRAPWNTTWPQFRETEYAAGHGSHGRHDLHCDRNENTDEETMTSSFKRNLTIGGVLGLGVIALIVIVVHPFGKASATATPPPPVVEFVQVEKKDVPIYSDWIGTLDGLVNADVRAQVTGYLMKQGYLEGSFVRKGQLLFQIDPRPFQAALDQAEGQLEQAKAMLANAEAVQGRTELDVKRYTPLAREQAASQQDLDNAVQNNLAALASVQTEKAQIKTDEAAVETAKINLEFTSLVAPIDGIAGQAQLQVGALVTPASGTVTSISTLDPIKVYFTVSEPQYLAWRKRFPTEISSEAAGKALHLQLILADGSTYSHEGTFYFADRQVNESTGAIRLAGLFPNARFQSSRAGTRLRW